MACDLLLRPLFDVLAHCLRESGELSDRPPGHPCFRRQTVRA